MGKTPSGKYAKAARLSCSSTAELSRRHRRLESVMSRRPTRWRLAWISFDHLSGGRRRPIVVRPNWRKRWWNAIVEATGALAGMATTAAFIPQVYQIYATGDTSGLSLSMYTIFVSGVSCGLFMASQEGRLPDPRQHHHLLPRRLPLGRSSSISTDDVDSDEGLQTVTQAVRMLREPLLQSAERAACTATAPYLALSMWTSAAPA